MSVAYAPSPATAPIIALRLGAVFLLLLLFAVRAFAGQVTLAWDPSPDTAVTGYSVYYGQTSGNLATKVDVGKQTTSTVTNLAAGTYFFGVKAYNAAGTESAFSNQVSAIVAAAAPTASFTSSVATGVAPVTVTFTSTTTGTVTGYSWKYGDNTTGTGASTSHTYTVPGTYTVTLTATGSGGSTTASKTITVSAAPPVANFTPLSASGPAPLTVAFAGPSPTTSTGALTYSWKFGNTATSTFQSPSYAYATPGTYTVSLAVTGPGGTSTKTGTVTVAAAVTTPTTPTNQAPNGTITTPAGPVTITQGQSVAFRGTGSDPNGDTLTYAWNLGGGAPGSTAQNPTVTFATAGTYTVSLTVTDSKGLPDPTPATTTVTVTPPAAINQAPNGAIAAPAAAITIPQGQSVAFQGSGTDPDGNTPFSYAWNFGGGATSSTAQNPTVTFATAGTYTVTLTVTDAKGLPDSSPATAIVTVTPPAAPLAPPPASTAQTLWSATAKPVTANDPGRAAVNLGVKFKSDVSGYITGIRFYKGVANTGTHVAALWTSRGRQLATATFTNETASGWQQVDFATPVPITANRVYVASYFVPSGGFAVDDDYFASAGVDSGSLHALGNGVSGGNGVYAYAAGTAFPISTYRARNYWVDVVFKPAN